MVIPPTDDEIKEDMIAADDDNIVSDVLLVFLQAGFPIDINSVIRKNTKSYDQLIDQLNL
jgi:hypothetical protein